METAQATQSKTKHPANSNQNLGADTIPLQAALEAELRKLNRTDQQNEKQIEAALKKYGKRELETRKARLQVLLTLFTHRQQYEFYQREKDFNEYAMKLMCQSEENPDGLKKTQVYEYLGAMRALSLTNRIGVANDGRVSPTLTDNRLDLKTLYAISRYTGGTRMQRLMDDWEENGKAPAGKDGNKTYQPCGELPLQYHVFRNGKRSYMTLQASSTNLGYMQEGLEEVGSNAANDLAKFPGFMRLVNNVGGIDEAMELLEKQMN